MNPTVVVLVVAAAGCGRVAFDPLDGDGATGMVTTCLADNFDDGDISDWTQTDPPWTASAGAGPEGTTVLRALDSGNSYRSITHPALRSIASFDASMDVLIESAAVGDFIVRILSPGWTTIDLNAEGYGVGIYPPGSDTTPDRIVARPVGILLASAEPLIPAQSWHRVVIRMELDHSINVEIDGALHMASPAVATYPGPFDLAIEFYVAGRIDNLLVRCLR